MSIPESAELFGKDPNYGLITPNGIIRHFIVFIEVEELGSLWFQLESHGQKGLIGTYKLMLYNEVTMNHMK